MTPARPCADATGQQSAQPARAETVRWARTRLAEQSAAMRAHDWAEAQRIGAEVITAVDRALGRTAPGGTMEGQPS